MVRINTIIYLSKFWKGFSLPFAMFSLFIYAVQYFNIDAYRAINKIAGLLPKIIEKVIPCSFEYQGETLSYSYVIIAAFIFITFFFASSQESKFTALKREKEQRAYLERERKEQFLREQLQKRQAKEEEQKALSAGFCGLFELKLEYLNSMNKSFDDLERLKKEYSKMIYKKLKEKYSKMKFATTDKIFFFSNTQEIFEEFLVDLMSLFEILKDLDSAKFIKTDFLLSFANEDEISSSKHLYKLLIKTNEMNNLNKVVAFDNFAKNYKKREYKKLDYITLGQLNMDVDTGIDYSGEFGYYIGY